MVIQDRKQKQIGCTCCWMSLLNDPCRTVDGISQNLLTYVEDMYLGEF